MYFFVVVVLNVKLIMTLRLQNPPYPCNATYIRIHKSEEKKSRLYEDKIQGESQQWNVIFQPAEHTFLSIYFFPFKNPDISHPPLHWFYIIFNLWLSYKTTLHSSLHPSAEDSFLCNKHLCSCLINWPTRRILSSLKGEENVVLKWYIHNICTSTPTFLSKSHTHNTRNHS